MSRENIKQFGNEKVIVTFHEKTEYNKAYIIAKDLTDRYNEPTIYTRKVRGIEKAWETIEKMFNDNEVKNGVTINVIQKILDENFKLNVHSYCAVD
ncbi:MAG: hypothetical protein PHQ01_02035 [Candidatus Pacebacteria bacterium]|nr:hypothetical protein [Candidatus Paceibacterota bacterium]